MSKKFKRKFRTTDTSVFVIEFSLRHFFPFSAPKGILTGLDENSKQGVAVKLKGNILKLFTIQCCTYIYIYIHTENKSKHWMGRVTSRKHNFNLTWRKRVPLFHPPFAIFIEGRKSSLVCDTYNNNVASRVGRKGERVRNISTKFSTISPTWAGT